MMNNLQGKKDYKYIRKQVLSFIPHSCKRHHDVAHRYYFYLTVRQKYSGVYVSMRRSFFLILK